MGSNKLKIGNVSLDGNIVLAPMAGVTDLPFRLLCKEQGADLICTEMVSAKGIFYNNKNTEDLLRIDDRERPVSLQLFGSDPDIISEMAKKIEHRNFDILDINMGCPVPKVVNNGEGSALLKNIPLAARIIEKTVKAIDKPVTVKFRKGFGADEVQAIEMAKAAEAAGAAGTSRRTPWRRPAPSRPGPASARQPASCSWPRRCRCQTCGCQSPAAATADTKG